jgi:bla regulator protein blaR1
MMLPTILRASLDGAILVALVWLVTQALPRLSPAARTILWWCASAKFLIALMWITPIPVPILPADDSAIPRVTMRGSRAASEQATPVPSSTLSPPQDSATSGTERGVFIALASAWAAGFLLVAGVSVRRWQQTIGAITRSSAAPLPVQSAAADLAARLGLRRAPEVRLSDDLQTPLVAGLVRPVVLLPAGRFAALSERQQQMTLCHELAHVKRADLWFGCVPALAERLFFFHPLAHVAAREYVFWREAACDAAVLVALEAAPQEYGRLLLHLGVSRPRTTLAAAGAPWSFSSLKRRILMLPDSYPRTLRSRLVASAAVTVALAALIPMRLAARPSPSVAVVEETPQQPNTTPAVPFEPGNFAAEPRVGGDFPQRDERDQEKSRDLNFVIFVSDDHTTMSGSTRDIERARRFKKPGEQMLWFREGGREYVVRDRAILLQVQSIWIPVHELGARQAKIGAEQAKLGSKQAEIGAQQAEIGARQARLGAQQGDIGGEQSQLGAREAARSLTDSEREALEKRQLELELRMERLGKEMEKLGDRMRELEKPMSDLGGQMDELGKEMDALGHKMEEASKAAEAEMQRLFERAIATGAAVAVK